MEWHDLSAAASRSAATHGAEAFFFFFFFLSSVLKAFLWSLQLYVNLCLKDSSWVKCWNVNLVTAPHGEAGNFCPFEVMPVKDGAGPNEGGKKPNPCDRLWDVEMGFFFFTLGLSSFDPCTSVSAWPRAPPPPCYLPVAGANSSEPALHPHPSLHITVTLSHSGPVPTVPRQQWEP